VKFACIHEHKKIYPINFMCRVFAVSRSGYNRFCVTEKIRAARATKEFKIARIIEDIHKGSRGRYGSPMIAAVMQGLPDRCGKNKVARIMKKYGIKIRKRKKFKKTTDSDHSLKIAPNHLTQNFKTYAPNQIWVGDITYVPTQKGWLYFASVIDLFSRKVVGWAFSERLKKEIVIDAFKMAAQRRRIGAKLVFHSDKGSQYASHAYRKVLADYDAIQSMSGTGNCWDNAVAESFFATLKRDVVHPETFADREHAKRQIFDWIEVEYNRRRPHSYLGYLSPEKFEEVHFMQKSG
jgi:putative transposase